MACYNNDVIDEKEDGKVLSKKEKAECIQLMEKLKYCCGSGSRVPASDDGMWKRRHREASRVTKERHSQGDVNKDKDDDVLNYHKSMIDAVVTLQRYYPKKLMRYFQHIYPYLIQVTSSADVDIATLGCTYWAWSSTADDSPLVTYSADRWAILATSSHLPILVSSLLACMTYRPEHVKHLERSDPLGSEESRFSSMSGIIVSKYSDLRNVGALAFENVCRGCGECIIDILNPYVSSRLMSDSMDVDWPDREVVILALTALTKSQCDTSHLHTLYPQLYNCLFSGYYSPHPLIRSITCFAMPHFLEHNSFDGTYITEQVTRATLDIAADGCAEARGIAIRSLTSLLTIALEDMTTCVGKIVDTLVNCCKTTSGVSRCDCFDCIVQLFARFGNQLSDEQVVRLLEPLMEQWDQQKVYDSAAEENQTTKNIEQAGGDDSFSHDDVDIVTLCQTLCRVMHYAGKARVMPHVDALVSGAARFIDTVLSSTQEHLLSLESRTDHLISSCDLLSSLFDVCGGADVMNNMTSSRVLYLLWKIFDNEGVAFPVAVQQSALALLGHLSRYQTSHRSAVNGDTAKRDSPLPADFLEFVIERINSNSPEVQSNALWALIFFARDPAVNKPRLLSVINDLIKSLKETNGEMSAVINAARALVSICANHPAQTVFVITNRDVFLHICGLLESEFPRQEEKEAIFRDLCAVLRPVVGRVQPPEVWGSFLRAVVTAVNEENKKLRDMLYDLLHAVRKEIGTPSWQMAMKILGPSGARLLRKYKIVVSEWVSDWYWY